MNKSLNILSGLNLDDITDIVRNAYKQEGYNGLFENTASFLFGDDNNIQLFAPEYARFMLYGRNSGKMPPKERIESWMDNLGIIGSPWQIMKKIANEGVEGNDFLSPVMPNIVSTISKDIANVAGKNISNYLTYAQ